jgi:hypothetical protein
MEEGQHIYVTIKVCYCSQLIAKFSHGRMKASSDANLNRSQAYKSDR